MTRELVYRMRTCAAALASNGEPPLILLRDAADLLIEASQRADPDGAAEEPLGEPMEPRSRRPRTAAATASRPVSRPGAATCRPSRASLPVLRLDRRQDGAPRRPQADADLPCLRSTNGSIADEPMQTHHDRSDRSNAIEGLTPGRRCALQPRRSSSTAGWRSTLHQHRSSDVQLAERSCSIPTLASRTRDSYVADPGSELAWPDAC